MRRLGAVLAGGGAMLLAADTASAVPAFARRYEVACHFCHDGYPKLNLNGQRFKERGFRMAQEDAFDVGDWLRTVPLAVRLIGNHTFVEDTADVNFAFGKGVSAGSLGRHLSYWVDDGVLYDDVSDASTHTKVDSGGGRIDFAQNAKFSLKGGRIELALPFTQARTPNLFSY